MGVLYNPPLQVVGFIATKVSDTDRGPEIRLQPFEAHLRMAHEGELVWIYGPRSHNLATVRIDETVPRGGVVVRDIVGLAVSEIVTLVRIDDAERPIITPAHA
jgi:hypothetical protein